MTGPVVASSLEDLLADAVDRRPMEHVDSKSGATFERVTIDGEPYVVKHLHVDDDWIMRATGDLAARPLLVWRSGLLHELPACIDHAVAGAAAGLGRNGWGAALLLHDVSPHLVPDGDQPVPLAQHLAFLDHMAALHAHFWGWTDTVGLAPPGNRLLEFCPAVAETEMARPQPEPVLPLIARGWSDLREVGGPVAAPVLDLVHDVAPLADALATLPQTLLHGDWKMGNLGSRPDGRTILLDWAVPGQGCPTLDLAWYLAINSARLPHTKEEAIAAYAVALAAHGVHTDPWWSPAIDLALLTGMVWFGWEKALGGPGPELQWWLDAARHGLQRL